MSEEKNLGGRPSEFSEDYIYRAHEYLEQCKDTFNDKGKIKVSLPTIEGFALFLGVSKVSLYEWEKGNKRFMNALSKIRDEQKKKLIDMGLSGDYNSTIAKLILSSNHGMKERSDLTSDDKQLPSSIQVEVKDFTENKKAENETGSKQDVQKPADQQE